MKKKLLGYYLRWLGYLLICLIDISLVNVFIYFTNFTGILAVLCYGLFAVLIFSLSVIAVFYKTQEFRYFKELAISLINKILKRKKLSD